MIDFEEMAKRHEALFPRADLASQIVKMEEEIGEFSDALEADNPTQAFKELADVAIVCIGIYRFAPNTARWIYDDACRRYKGLYGKQDVKKLEAEVKRKWAINESRTWEWNGKTYHHVEKK